MIGKAQAKRLQDRIDANMETRRKAIEASQPYRDRTREINDAPGRLPRMEFWCEACGVVDDRKGDVVAVAYKDVKHPKNQLPIARYVGYCPKGHMVMRFITDKNRDPYYHLSVKMQYERRRSADDMLQPNDPRFRIVYPRQWEKMEADRHAAEESAAIEAENLKHARR